MFVSESMPEWELVFLSTPSLRKIYLELTNRCNLACSMCYRHSWSASEGEMGEDVFTNILLSIPGFPQLEEIVLGGLGEPLCHRDFWSMLALLRKALPKGKIVLTTNGVTLDSEMIRKLARFGVNRIVLSVDGADIAMQSEIRGAEAGCVSEKLNGLGKIIAKTQGVSWWWETVWQQKNKHQLPEIVRLASRSHVEKLVVTHLMPVTSSQIGQALFDPPLAEADRKIFIQARNQALLYGLTIQTPKEKSVTERHCTFVESGSTVIGWDGRIAPCYRFLHGCKEYYLGRYKDVPAFQFGNLKEENLREIWSKKKYQQFRYRMINSLYPSCPDCEFVDGCSVVSRADWDCDGGVPACGDCLWCRNMIICP